MIIMPSVCSAIHCNVSLCWRIGGLYGDNSVSAFLVLFGSLVDDAIDVVSLALLCLCSLQPGIDISI